MAMVLWILGALLSLTNSKLLQAITLITPGARYHINDLYDGEQFRDKWGQLSPVGMRQHQWLGNQLRDEYIRGDKLLSEDWNKGHYEQYSVKMDASIQSALAFLYGMYPLGKGQKLIAVDPKYHIPPYGNPHDASEGEYSLPEGQLVEPMSYSTSILLEDCPNEEAEKKKNLIYQKSQLDEMNLTYTPFFNRMKESFYIQGRQVDLSTMADLADTVRVDRYLGRRLPQSVTAGDVANLQHLLTYWGLVVNNYNLSQAFNSGKLKHILQLFDGRKGGSGSVRWSTLGVFEGDMYSALNDLNISSARCVQQTWRRGSSEALNCALTVPFASSLIFELHQQGQAFNVMVRYNGKYVNLCQKGSTVCEYGEWRSRVGKYILADPTSVCGGKKQQQTPMILTQ